MTDIFAIVSDDATATVEPTQTLRATLQKTGRPALAGVSDDGQAAVDPGERRHRPRVPVAQHRSYVSDTTSRPPAAQQFL